MCVADNICDYKLYVNNNIKARKGEVEMYYYNICMLSWSGVLPFEGKLWELKVNV